MVPKMLQLRCAGDGSDYTAADALKAAGVTIGGALALVLGLTWAIARYGENPYLESFMAVGWLVPFVYSQRYMYLKGHSARVQAVLIGGPVVVLIAIAIGNAWLNKS